MITTKKSGPPVPPRPNISSFAKSQSSSSVPLLPGRTVIYKSPSYNKITKNHDEDQVHNVIGNNNHALPHKVTTATATTDTTTAHSTSNSFKAHYDGISSSNRTEIIIASKNTISVSNANEPIVILDSGVNNEQSLHEHERKNGSSDNNGNIWENSHKLEIIQKSPVARPRQNAPSKKIVKPTNECVNEIMSMSQIIVLGEKDRLIKNIDDLNCTSVVPDEPIESKNEHVIAFNELNSIERLKINSCLEEKKNQKNLNKYGTVVERLFTEIAINSNVKTPVKVQSKLEHCIKVRTPSPPNASNTQCNPSHLTKVTLQSDDIGDNNDDKMGIEKKVTFHQQLISELAEMHKEDEPRTRYPSSCSTDSSPNGTHRSRIRTADWVEVGDNGKEVLLSSCQISLEDSGMEDEERLDDISSGVGDSWDSAKDGVYERMSLPGLPPLPKSLSGLESTGAHPHNSTNFSSIESQRGVSPVNRKTSTLDTQLAILRREMFGLRQLDLSLLSQLWALNESIQEFRTIIQEQEALSPPSPSPSPSDTNSVSSDSGDEGDSSNQDRKPSAIQTQQQKQHILQQQQAQQHQQQRMRAAPPPPPNRKAPSRPPV